MIHYFCEDIDFTPPHPKKTRDWLIKVIEIENHEIGNLNYIFCSNNYLLKLNESYLKHSTLTDIITFDHHTDPGVLEGDIYISVDQVSNNSDLYKESFDRELKRVMVHGILHLLGYNDKTLEEQHEMRKKEEAYLSL